MTLHTMTDQERIAYLEAMVAKLSKSSKLTLKVSEKGAISVYGMGKFPITHYVGQWERILDNVEQIREFITANNDKLSRKD